MFEQMIRWYHRAYGLKAASFRYFNAAGATEARGEAHRHESHLIPLVLDVAAGDRPSVNVYGTDYPTRDGTCVRDYVHVSDIADAHLLALDALDRLGLDWFNIGTGTGNTVDEVVTAVERVTGRQVHDDAGAAAPRRPGHAGGELGPHPRGAGLVAADSGPRRDHRHRLAVAAAAPRRLCRLNPRLGAGRSLSSRLEAARRAARRQQLAAQQSRARSRGRRPRGIIPPPCASCSSPPTSRRASACGRSSGCGRWRARAAGSTWWRCSRPRTRPSTTGACSTRARPSTCSRSAAGGRSSTPRRRCPRRCQSRRPTPGSRPPKPGSAPWPPAAASTSSTSSTCAARCWCRRRVRSPPSTTASTASPGCSNRPLRLAPGLAQRAMARLDVGRTRRFEASLSRRFDRMIASSEAEARAFRALGPAADPGFVTALRNGVDLGAPPGPPADDGRTVLFAGKIELPRQRGGGPAAGRRRDAAGVGPPSRGAAGAGRQGPVAGAPGPGGPRPGRGHRLRARTWRPPWPRPPCWPRRWSTRPASRTRCSRRWRGRVPVVTSTSACAALEAVVGRDVVSADDDGQFAAAIVGLLEDRLASRRGGGRRPPACRATPRLERARPRADATSTPTRTASPAQRHRTPAEAR